MISNLSKLDYYRSKNIPTPKICTRINPEPPVRLHMIDIVPNMRYEVIKLLESHYALEECSMEIIECHRVIQELEDKVQVIINEKMGLEEQLLAKKLKMENDERKIGGLEREVIQLKNREQKMEFEGRLSIESVQREYEGIIVAWERKYKELEQMMESRKKVAIECSEEQGKEWKERAEECEKEMKRRVGFLTQQHAGLTGEFSKLTLESKRLTEQLISSENENIIALQRLENENYRLNENLVKLMVENKSLFTEQQNEIAYHTSLQKDLEAHNIQLQKSIDNQRELYLREKQALTELMEEESKKLKKQGEILLETKQELQEEIRRLKGRVLELERKENMQLRRIEELEEGMRGEQGRWERKLVECVEMGKGKICEVEREWERKMFDVEDRRLMEEKGRVDERKRMEDRVNYVVKEWEGKMDKVVREGDMKENENRRLKEQVETLEIEITQVKQAIEQLKAYNLSLARAHQSDLQHLRGEHENDIQTVENKLRKSFEQERVRLQQELSSKEGTIIATNNRIMELETNRSILENNSQHLQTTIDKLNTEILDKNTTILSLEQQLKEKCTEATDNTRKIAELKVELEYKESALIAAKQEIQMISGRLTQCDNIRLQALKKFKEAEENYAGKIMVLENEQIRLLKCIKQLELNLEHERSAHGLIKNRLSSMENELALYRDENIKLKSHASENMANKNGLIDEIKRDYEIMKNNIEQKLEFSQTKFTTILKEKEEQIDLNNKEIQRMTNLHKQCSEELMKKELELSQLYKEMTGCKINGEQFEEYRGKMEMELGNMRNVIKMQNKDLELLRVDNEQLMKDIEVRRRTETDFQYRIANHDRFRLQMEDTAKGKDKAIESLRQENGIIRRELDQANEALRAIANKNTLEADIKMQALMKKLDESDGELKKTKDALMEKEKSLTKIEGEHKEKMKMIDLEVIALKTKCDRAVEVQKAVELHFLKLNSVLSKTKESSEKIINEQEMKIATLEENNKRALEENDRKLKENEQAARKYKELEEGFTKEIIQLNEQIEECQKWKAQSEKSLEINLRNNEYLETIIIKLENDYRKVEDRLKEQEKQAIEAQECCTKEFKEKVKMLEGELVEQHKRYETERGTLVYELKQSYKKFRDIEISFHEQGRQWTQKYNVLLLKCKSANSQLNEYRKKWARICGEVSEFSTELNEVAEECEFNVQMFEVRGEGCTGGKYVEKMTNGKEVEDKTERKNMEVKTEGNKEGKLTQGNAYRTSNQTLIHGAIEPVVHGIIETAKKQWRGEDLTEKPANGSNMGSTSLGYKPQQEEPPSYRSEELAVSEVQSYGSSCPSVINEVDSSMEMEVKPKKKLTIKESRQYKEIVDMMDEENENNEKEG